MLVEYYFRAEAPPSSLSSFFWDEGPFNMAVWKKSSFLDDFFSLYIKTPRFCEHYHGGEKLCVQFLEYPADNTKMAPVLQEWIVESP